MSHSAKRWFGAYAIRLYKVRGNSLLRTENSLLGHAREFVGKSLILLKNSTLRSNKLAEFKKYAAQFPASRESASRPCVQRKARGGSATASPRECAARAIASASPPMARPSSDLRRAGSSGTAPLRASFPRRTTA